MGTLHSLITQKASHGTMEVLALIYIYIYLINIGCMFMLIELWCKTVNNMRYTWAFTSLINNILPCWIHFNPNPITL